MVLKKNYKLKNAVVCCKKLTDMWKTVQITAAGAIAGSPVKSPVKSPLKSPLKSSSSPKKSVSNSSTPKKKYQVCELNSNEEIQLCQEVAHKDLSRQKGAYNKDKNKLFLKQHVTLKNGILAVKDNVISKNNLKSYSLEAACAGTEPVFEKSPARIAPVSKKNVKNATQNSSTNHKNKSKEVNKDTKNGQMDIAKALTQKPASKKITETLTDKESEPDMTEDEKRREQLLKKYEEAKQKKLEQHQLEKERKKEEKRLIAEYVKEYNKPRDDLECDDLKDLPLPHPVKCNIPQEVFGDALNVVEFMNLFGHLFKLKSTFPGGISFEIFHRAVSETDIDGPFNDMVQMMLLAVFKQQEAEYEIQKGLNISVAVNDIDEYLDEDSDPSTAKAIKAAKVAATWSQCFHGTILRKMPLDPFTVSELFRLHILASGSEVSSSHLNRLGDRGYYSSRENPGLYFKIEEPEIVKTLSTDCVFQLKPDQKIKVLKVLADQLLTYDVFRDYIDEEFTAKQELRILRYNFARKPKDGLKKKTDENVNEKNGNENKDGQKTPTAAASPVELTEEEVQLQVKKAQEDAKAQEEFAKKEKDLLNQLSKLRGAGGVIPIGEDRAFRRYWLFRYVGGVFVEDDNPFVGDCLEIPTPTQPIYPCIGNKSQDEVPLSLIKRYLTVNKGNQNGQSDKENEVLEALNLNNHVPSKSQKLLSDANPRVNSPSKAKKSSEITEITEIDKPKVYGMCTANVGTCPIHGLSRSTTKWSFFYKESEIEQLIMGLNPRGERELQLRNFLSKEKMLWTTSLEKCPSSKLNSEIIMEEEQEVRKSSRVQKSVFANVHPCDALETTFRDALLDNEEKLWGGGLGYIKVNDRDAWRKAIEDRTYEMQCTDLTFGRKHIKLPLTVSDKIDISSESSESQRSNSPAEPNQLVIDMACALLQVAQSVEKRYLLEPLGEDARHRAKKQRYLERLEKKKISSKESAKSEDDDSGEEPIIKVKYPASPLERWEESLLSCTSLSQLFVHLATLERSIFWERSASKANCRVCKRKGDPEKMLLCDGCDRGFHMYCLKPPLEVIPLGDWFCSSCEPTSEEPRPSKKLNYKDVTDSEEEEEDDDDEECEEEESDEDDENSGTKCTSCKKGGELLNCDGCSASFHPECLKPPLRRIPRGSWNCQKCVKKANKKKSPDDSERDKRPSKNRKLNSPPSAKSNGPTGSRCSRRLSNNSFDDSFDYKGCCLLLDQLQQHTDSWPFLKPVTKKDAPNYLRIIKRPIDLGTIRSRLNNQTYSNNEHLVADIYLMFQNCEVYNDTDTPQYEAGKRLARFFQTLTRQFKMDNPRSRKASFDAGLKDVPTKRLRRIN